MSRGRPAPLHVTLTEAPAAELRRWQRARHLPALQVRRGRCVLLRAQGSTLEAIAHRPGRAGERDPPAAPGRGRAGAMTPAFAAAVVDVGLVLALLALVALLVLVVGWSLVAWVDRRQARRAGEHLPAPARPPRRPGAGLRRGMAAGGRDGGVRAPPGAGAGRAERGGVSRPPAGPLRRRSPWGGRPPGRQEPTPGARRGLQQAPEG